MTYNTPILTLSLLSDTQTFIFGLILGIVITVLLFIFIKILIEIGGENEKNKSKKSS